MMNTPFDDARLSRHFRGLYGSLPGVIASAPGRLEVLGNHTDYNAGLTLSCAVGERCYAALAPIDEPAVRLASTLFNAPPESFAAGQSAPSGHWANYVLGLVDGLRVRGYDVPGFALLVDSALPRSAGMSSSAALEMAVLTGLSAMMRLDLPAIELARIGQHAESSAVGAQTGLLDQLTALLGRRDGLLQIDFQSLQTRTITSPPGWCFVAVDSGVKHDLTAAYNDRRASCAAAASVLGVGALRGASEPLLDACRSRMSEQAYRCAMHIVGENRRVAQAVAALEAGDIQRVGALMFASHESSREHFRNSCPELDELVALAQADPRCVGARLSGGGFGGISIHLVKMQDARAYREDLLAKLGAGGDVGRWSGVCRLSEGAWVDVLGGGDPVQA